MECQRAAVCPATLLRLAVCAPLAQGGDDENDEFQFNVNPHHTLTDQLSIVGDIGHFDNPNDYSQYRSG